MKTIKNSKKKQLEQMAKKIVLILESENVSETIQEAIFFIADEAIINAEDETSRREYINERFVRALLSHDAEYAKAVLSSLNSVMEHCIADEVYQPILSKSLGK